MKKGLKCLCLMLVLSIILTTTAFADGNDSHYALFGHKLRSGIENVTCSNQVDPSYAYAWAAVEHAINDWDWHLSLLNTSEFNYVDWNMTSVGRDVTDAHIRIVMIDTITYGKTEPYAVTWPYNAVFVEEPTLWNFTYPTDADWDYAVVWLDKSTLEQDGLLDDQYAIKRIVNHEIGHALGLAHYDDPGVIMYSQTDGMTATVPTRADLMGIYQLYGSGEYDD